MIKALFFISYAFFFQPLVEAAMPCIIGLLQDESPAVRDSTAWTIGRVCETLPEVALHDTYLVQLLTGLVSGLVAEPRVAANVCWALSSLADSAYDVAISLQGWFLDFLLTYFAFTWPTLFN